MRGHTSGSRPIISQIICTGTWAAISSTNSTSPFSQTLVDDHGGPPLDLLDELRDHPRREALRHQPPVAVVLGRVHVEDREPQAGQRLLVLVGMNVPPELGARRCARSWLTARTSACLVSAQNPVSSGSGCQ